MVHEATGTNAQITLFLFLLDRLIFIARRLMHSKVVQFIIFHYSEYFVGDNSEWLKYIKLFDRTWTAAEGPKKDVYNIGKLFCVFKAYVVSHFDLDHFRGQRSVVFFSIFSNLIALCLVSNKMRIYSELEKENLRYAKQNHQILRITQNVRQDIKAPDFSFLSVRFATRTTCCKYDIIVVFSIYMYARPYKHSCCW